MAFVRRIFARDDSPASERVSRAILRDFKTKLDPLRVGDFKSPVYNKLAVNFYDMDVIGLSKMHVIKTHFDRATMIVTITVSGSNIKATAKYSPEPDGEAAHSEKADCWLEAEYVTATIAMRMQSLDLDNLEHIKVDDIEFKMRYINTHFDDLKGDKQFNEYFRFFSHELVLVLEVQVPLILQKELQKFVHDELKKVDSNARTKEARVASLPQESPFHRALHRPTYDKHAMIAAVTSGKKTEGNLDALFDFFIPNINALIVKEGFDPLKAGKGSKDSFDFWVISGGYEIEPPTLYGLSHLKRTGPLDIDKLTLTVSLGIDGEVTGGTCAKVWLGPFSVGPDISYAISNIDIRVVMTLEKDKAGKTKISLDKLELPTGPKVSVDIHGLGPLMWIEGILHSAFSNLVLEILEQFLQTSLAKKIINVLLQKLELPI